MPAFTGLGAPHWDQYARRAIRHDAGRRRKYIIRAALEGIAYSPTLDVAESHAGGLGVMFKELRVDGGATQATAFPMIRSSSPTSSAARCAVR